MTEEYNGPLPESVRIYRFGNDQVITAAGTMQGQPVLAIGHARDFPAGKPNAEQLMTHPDTIVLQMGSAEGAIFVVTQIFLAVQHTAEKLGVPLDDIQLPVVPTQVHDAALARIAELEGRPTPKSFL